LSIIVTGANRHDCAVLEDLLDERTTPQELSSEHLPHMENICLDAGYTGKEDVVLDHGMCPHIRPRGEEKVLIEKHGFKPKRWIVELCHSWYNRFRKIHVRYEKTELAYRGLVFLASAIIVFNRITGIYPSM